MNDRKSDISLGQAVLLAVGVAAAFLLLLHKALMIRYLSAGQIVFNQTPVFWSALCMLTLNNLFWVGGVITRKIGLRGQGSRLRALSGDLKDSTSLGATFSVTGFFLGCILGLIGLCTIPIPAINFLYGFENRIFGFFAIQAGVTSSLLWNVFRDLKFSFSSWLQSQKKLPDFPFVDGGIVLGSAHEGDPKRKPTWISCDRKALNAGVLITGSIGSGKTQGTVLPYFSQALTNFNPRPAILALDPKRRFIQEAKDMIKDAGLTDCLRVISLDGNQTFNPVYVDKILKNARFLDSAEMVRAAALNFSGGAADSPFWEISGFNLLKNAIVYCAAVKGYFTLKMSTERWSQPHPSALQMRCA